MPPQTLAGPLESLEQRVTVLGNNIVARDERVVTSLREEIRATAEEIMRHARMLHEDLLSRIALLAEGRPGPRGRTKRR